MATMSSLATGGLQDPQRLEALADDGPDRAMGDGAIDEVINALCLPRPAQGCPWRLPPPPELEPTPEVHRQRWRCPTWLEKGDIHEWTKTVAVVVASLWGIYTFVWKDILVPSWAPSSLVIEVTAQPERPNPSAHVRQPPGMVPMRLQFTVTNPTQRPLYLLANVWWDSSIKRQAAIRGASFETITNAALILFR